MRVTLGFDIFDAGSPSKKLEGKELEAVVDDDIRRFEKFMVTRVDRSGPLSNPEKAIIKTYLWWKVHHSPVEEDHAEDPGSQA